MPKPVVNKLLFTGFILLAVVAGAAFLWRRPFSRGPESSAPGGSPHRESASLAASPIYLQTDPRWCNEQIGGSKEKLSAVGCTVCCVSMALAEHGIQLDPGALNRELKKRGGYTRRGWLKWDAVRQVTGGKVRVRIPGSPRLSEIDAALQAGNPVIAKVLLVSGIQHWVLVVRREGKEYLIKDPLGDGRHLSKLSQFESGVLAIRIVQKAR